MTSSNGIVYSDRYKDSAYEYRHVILSAPIAKAIPQLKSFRLMSEAEWRGHGIQQSRGWVHYAYHRPEPHILLFRRPLPPPSPSPSAGVRAETSGMETDATAAEMTRITQQLQESSITGAAGDGAVSAAPPPGFDSFSHFDPVE